MTSMTGYAYKECSRDGVSASVEVKSVNSRYLELGVGLPPYLSRLEGRIRDAASARISRGKVDIFVRVKEAASNERVTADVDAARSYFDAISQVAKALGMDAEGVPLSLVLSQEGVLNSAKEYDIEKYAELIMPLLDETLAEFTADCAREGENLFRDLSQKLCALEGCAHFFREWQPKMEEIFAQTIRKKFAELLGENFDEQRVMAEVASMLVKYTINEEVVRLFSHLAALKKEMAENSAPGKKIDFLCQEINREINTIGSKSQFAEVSAKVVEAKDALENVREQARNVA